MKFSLLFNSVPETVGTRKGEDVPEMHVVLKEVDEEAPDPNRVFVMAEVYAPNIPDTDGEFMTAEEIRKMAHDFISSGRVANIDVMHDGHHAKDVRVVESFIVDKSDERFIADAWVIAVQIDNPELAQKVRKGELNGFSMESLVAKQPEQEVEIEVPPVVQGMCAKAEGHDHEFFVNYDADTGKFRGGYTSKAADGHSHVIRRGTATETTAGHNHRFCAVDEVSMVAQGER